MSNKVAFCQATFDRDWERTRRCVERMHGGVDLVLIVTDETVPEEEAQSLEEDFGNTKVRRTEFKESLPEFRNEYVEMAKDEGCSHIIVSDPDELFNEKLAEDIKGIAEEMEQNGIDVAGVNCVEKFEVPGETEWWDELDELKEYPSGRESDFFKNLIFELKENFKYVGVGKGDVHETVKPEPSNPIRLPKKYQYTHEKSPLEVWRNAGRNMVLGGGGDNVKDLNPYYEEIHELMDSYNIESWQELEGLITGEGGVKFLALEDHIVDEWVDFFKRCLDAPNNDWGRETRQLAKFFFIHNQKQVDEEVLDKIENPPERSEEQKARDKVRKLYFQLLGRHPDREGLEYYAQKIIEEGVSLEDVEEEIRKSEEFLEKHGVEEFSVTEALPVDMTIHLTDERMMKILEKAEIYERVARRVELAKEIEEKVEDVDEFYNRFYEKRELGELDISELVEGV